MMAGFRARRTPVDLGPALRITDGVLAEIRARIAGKPPERGGVLLGVGTLIHAFLDDDHGDYSGGHWDVSAEVVELCNRTQLANRGTYVGQLHSHPDGIPDPSSQDRHLMLGALDHNPHRDYLLLPVLTRGLLDGNLPVGGTHQISFMAAVRGQAGDGGRIVRFDPPTVIPLCADLEAAGIRVGSATSTSTVDWRGDLAGVMVRVDGRDWLGYRTDTDRVLLVSDSYPEQPPHVLDAHDERPRPINAWDPGSDRAAQIRQSVTGPEPRAAHRHNRPALARVTPLIGDLGEAHVVIAGAGSVGSRIAEDLCRAGVGSLTLVDPDVVAEPNLARSVYTHSDIDQLKVAALSDRLVSINPKVHVDALPQSLSDIDISQLISDAALVVGATDDMEQQFQLSHHSYAAGVPMVCCALYRLAAAGEVVLAVPSAATACIRCSLADANPEVRPDKNYGAGGRLVAEPGLGPSIQLVSSYASLLILGLLAGPDAASGRQVGRLLATRRTYGKIAVEPEWDFFPRVLGRPAHQHAPQSVWITVPPRSGCQVCGETRRPPMTAGEAAELAAYIAAG